MHFCNCGNASQARFRPETMGRVSPLGVFCIAAAAWSALLLAWQWDGLAGNHNGVLTALAVVNLIAAWGVAVTARRAWFLVLLGIPGLVVLFLVLFWGG